MAALMSTGRFCLQCISVQITQIRTRVKSHNVLQRNIRPHKSMERRVFDALTQPIFVRETLPPAIQCSEKRMRVLNKPVNQYEEFLDRQGKKLLERYMDGMIVVCQCLPITEKTFKKRKHILNKNGLRLYTLRNSLVRKALTDTKLANLLPLAIGTNVYIMSHSNMTANLMKSIRKIPEFIILGGVLDNRLLSKQELEQVSKLPNIETLRGELVSILNQAAGERTYRLLGSHQQTLSTNLEQLVKQSQENSDENKDQQSQENSGENKDQQTQESSGENKD